MHQLFVSMSARKHAEMLSGSLGCALCSGDRSCSPARAVRHAELVACTLGHNPASTILAASWGDRPPGLALDLDLREQRLVSGADIAYITTGIEYTTGARQLPLLCRWQ
jgi:hypothetical protein